MSASPSDLESAVRAALTKVIDPELRRPITEIGMVKAVTAEPDGSVHVEIYLTTSACPKKTEISDQVSRAVSDVPGLLSLPSLTRTIRLTHEACLRFGVPRPRLGVLALNPHAGEHGLFGKEEDAVIRPAIALARESGIDASGPLVPDTAFTWLVPGNPAPFDAYVAMYHDQALIPFKMVAFDTGVNVTLGLPLVRTSPDHGTAFDLAWQGKASPASLFSAIRLAADMARRA